MEMRLYPALCLCTTSTTDTKRSMRIISLVEYSLCRCSPGMSISVYGNSLSTRDSLCSRSSLGSALTVARSLMCHARSLVTT